MEHKLQLTMPTNGSENDWIEYIGVIKSDSRWTSGRNQAERLLLGWQVHRTAMKMLRTEIWRKYPLLKRPAWDTVKETLAFMDETMGCSENISDEDRMIWRREYEECFFSLPWIKKDVYSFSCSSRLYDCKRQSETLVTTEVLVKKCNKETGEREDEDAVTDKSNYEEIDLSREPTEQQSLDRRTIDMLFEDSDEHDSEDNLEDEERVEC